MLEAVRRLRQEWIDFTSGAIAIPSFAGQEEEMARYVLAALEKMGAEASVDGAGNVLGFIRGTGQGPNVMLNSHLDVVPAGNLTHWLPYEPFKAALDGEGNLIGRGASDLKAGLTAQLFAFRLIKEAADSGAPLPGDLCFAGVVHEESAEMMGMEYLLETTLPEMGWRCDLVYLCEPSSGDVALGHRGKVELVVTTHGRAAHSSQPKEGINALQKMLPVLEAIFGRMQTDLKSHPVLGESSMTVTDCIVRPGALSIIPDSCEISIDRRYMPGETIDDLMARFDALFKELQEADPEFRATVQPRVFVERTYTGVEKAMKKYHPPWVTAQDHPLMIKTLDALRAAGQSPRTKYWKFGTDGSMSAGIHGIPTIGYSGAEEKWAHQPKEQVSVDAMLGTIEGYVSILCALYGLDVARFRQ